MLHRIMLYVRRMKRAWEARGEIYEIQAKLERASLSDKIFH